MGSNPEYDLASIYFQDIFTELFTEEQEIVSINEYMSFILG